MRTASLVVPVVLGFCGLNERRTVQTQSPIVPPSTAPVNVLVQRMIFTSYWPLGTFHLSPQRSVFRLVELTETVSPLSSWSPPVKVSPLASLIVFQVASPTAR